jgi:hypothetical protein
MEKIMSGSNRFVGVARAVSDHAEPSHFSMIETRCSREKHLAGADSKRSKPAFRLKTFVTRA